MSSASGVVVGVGSRVAMSDVELVRPGSDIVSDCPRIKADRWARDNLDLTSSFDERYKI
jgi:hypothetical protein